MYVGVSSLCVRYFPGRKKGNKSEGPGLGSESAEEACPGAAHKVCVVVVYKEFSIFQAVTNTLGEMKYHSVGKTVENISHFICNCCQNSDKFYIFIAAILGRNNNL